MILFSILGSRYHFGQENHRNYRWGSFRYVLNVERSISYATHICSKLATNFSTCKFWLTLVAIRLLQEGAFWFECSHYHCYPCKAGSLILVNNCCVDSRCVRNSVTTKWAKWEMQLRATCRYFGGGGFDRKFRLFKQRRRANSRPNKCKLELNAIWRRRVVIPTSQ